MAELKQQFKDMETKVVKLEKNNEFLEAEVELLESSRIITENAAKQLANEIDRLSQHTRRSNVIVMNVFKPEKENK